MSTSLAFLIAYQAALGFTSPTCESGASMPGQALFQTRRMVPSSLAAEGSENSQRESLPLPMLRSKALQPSGVNPSGAAATLDEVGYVSVADRCCQSEMIEFTKRQIATLGLEVCIEAGLRGIVPYHSCEFGLQSFKKLTADLLRDSEDRCGWLRKESECAPIPSDCPEYTKIIPFYDCGCNRTLASVLEIGTTSSLVYNNLGGVGPVKTDPQELRFNSGTSYSGAPFDLVITNLTEYTPGNIGNNGKTGGFGKITMKCDTEAQFRFSFVEPGTNNPVVQDEVHMATYDLDGGGYGGGLEYVSSVGYAGYVTDPNPNLLATLYNGTDVRTTFTSIGRSWDNPSDPNTLTEDQRRNAVMFFYKDVSSFEVNFGISGGDSGRTLYFSFLCALDDRCGQ